MILLCAREGTAIQDTVVYSFCKSFEIFLTAFYPHIAFDDETLLASGPVYRASVRVSKMTICIWGLLSP